MQDKMKMVPSVGVTTPFPYELWLDLDAMANECRISKAQIIREGTRKLIDDYKKEKETA